MDTATCHFFGGRHMEARSHVAPAVIQGSTRRSHCTIATTGDVYPTLLSCKKLPTARVPNPSCNKSPTAWYPTGTLPDILTTPELCENVYVCTHMYRTGTHSETPDSKLYENRKFCTLTQSSLTLFTISGDEIPDFPEFRYYRALNTYRGFAPT